MREVVAPISISRASSRIVGTLRGAVDAGAAPLLRPLLWDLIDGQGNLDVVIDLWDVDWIDSAGVSLLTGTVERMHHPAAGSRSAASAAWKTRGSTAPVRSSI